QALEAAVIDVESAAEVIGLASSAAFGKWRDDRNILLTKTNRVDVQSRKDTPAMLDGERVNLGRSAEIDFVSRAVTVIVPASRWTEKLFDLCPISGRVFCDQPFALPQPCAREAI